MKALLVVDMQNDFMPGGALAVSDADQIIATINQLMSKFAVVVATQDWHPLDHVSFAVNHPGKREKEIIKINNYQQILWPVHCVQNTKGAALVSNLKHGDFAAVFHKGIQKEIDSYSTFFDNAKQRETGLHHYLNSRKIEKLYLAGVATDYCVLYSVLDALELGYEVNVVIDACKGINLAPKDIEKAIKLMEKKGAKIVHSHEVERAI